MNTITKSFLALFLTASLASCYKDFQHRVVGNGNVITETRTLPSFEKVNSSGSFEIEIINDPSVSKVEVEAESNIIPVLETEVRGNELEIQFERNTSVRTHKRVKVKVFTGSLSGLSLSGSGTMNAAAFTGNSFESNVSGSGNISFHFTGTQASYDISGSGKITGAGKVTSQDIKVSGSGDIEALDLETENTAIDISGSGTAKVFATKTLKAEISGSGNITYKGNPFITSSISGSGKLIRW